MIVFPHAKINVGLYLTEKRQDGFHNLQTCFVPVGIHDGLEILPTLRGKNTSFTSSGLPIPGQPEHNLCLRAHEILREQHHIPQVRIHLHKVIPMGAGLGGGSSDAAFTLQALNQLFELKLSKATLSHYASQLGSDCAFFMQPQPAIGTGKGDRLTPTTVSLSNLYLAVIKPPVSVSTAEAYRDIVPAQPAMPLEEQLRHSISTWKYIVFNDFEKTVFTKHPEIAHIKDTLYSLGALYAAMSGSGSAVFGLFAEPPALKGQFPTCQVFAPIRT